MANRIDGFRIEKIESIQSLEKCAELLMEAYNAEPWNDQWTKEKAWEKLTCFYNSPKFLGWMAIRDNNLLGACLGNIEPYYIGDYFYLKEMFVSVHCQRQGVGSKLMAALKNHLEIIDIKTIILFTSKDGFPFDFYQKNDFNIMEGMCMMNFGAIN
ncbi:GNAT family N-acetyltransferase [Laspinema sp. A4]|uniref:GNAT family N-acetyltransferase n=1 Tax=Laspinema sp. D2d TaxID=2953686 RepID=UPI0021BB1169|nr:GNAT family N-acetyltransferase [Laspinema sp. D2d]MCT7982946.1 GNAT family N-acetyltransferase [Laspinema sp. D2d]